MFDLDPPAGDRFGDVCRHARLRAVLEDEVAGLGLRPQQFTVSSIAARLERSCDPWQTMTRHRRGLAAARPRLAAPSAAMT